ncbi:CYTH domain-containing protein [Thorsellia kenyensis]|uniref:Inorganic triphosphatase n=1 Tax=Thorsellia kenyensis TaxID=1549888 RepID=A0ABV6CAL4_9GAMM
MPAKNLEIELKFSLLNDKKYHLLDFLSKHCRAQFVQKKLSNTYFETRDNILRQHDSGLRIRGFDDQFEMTLKTAALGPNGLLKREEYNYPLLEPVLDLDLFPVKVWPNSINLSYLKENLEPQFTTDFIRTLCLIEVSTASGITTIEVALDEGYIAAGGLRESIYEVELELKEGPLDGMFKFAHQLMALNCLRLSELTKAARGYRLNHCHLNRLKPENLPLTAPASTNISHQYCFLLNKLFYLEESFLRSMLDYESFAKILLELPTSLTSTTVEIQFPIPENAFIDQTHLNDYIFSAHYNAFKLTLLESIAA